jgi:antitoxin component YwqK of YwqJK toxin-antitoxin module
MKSIVCQFESTPPSGIDGIGATISPVFEIETEANSASRVRKRGIPMPLISAMLAVLMVAGCYDRAQGTDPAKAQKNASDAQSFGYFDSQSGEKRLNEQRQGNEINREYDLNRDKKADVWKYFVVTQDGSGKTSERLVRKEFDVNFDGRVDVIRFYDQSQMLSKESFDLDFDGRIDQINFYEVGQLVRKEKDLNFDQKTDLWIFHEQGKVVRKERDSNNDGKIDYWEYWENDQVDRIGEDLDGDGTVDRWSKNQVEASLEE